MISQAQKTRTHIFAQVRNFNNKWLINRRPNTVCIHRKLKSVTQILMWGMFENRKIISDLLAIPKITTIVLKYSRLLRFRILKDRR